MIFRMSLQKRFRFFLDATRGSMWFFGVNDRKEFDMNSTWEDAMKKLELPMDPRHKYWIYQESTRRVRAAPKEKIKTFVEKIPGREVYDVVVRKAYCCTYADHETRTRQAEEEKSPSQRRRVYQ